MPGRDSACASTDGEARYTCLCSHHSGSWRGVRCPRPTRSGPDGHARWPGHTSHGKRWAAARRRMR
eukprot:8518560-Alexandrium_andersonii.AAC.1